MMIRQRRQTGFGPVINNSDSAATSETAISEIVVSKFSLFDYFKFVFYCTLLIVPVYAIVRSAIKHDWLMMVIDALLVPVGFVHGILLIFGYVN